MSERKMFYFTFGFGQENQGKYQPILASSSYNAREKMFEMYGDKWCFEYSEQEWKTSNCEYWYPKEVALPLVTGE
jgi:hypothetical protein